MEMRVYSSLGAHDSQTAATGPALFDFVTAFSRSRFEIRRILTVDAGTETDAKRLSGPRASLIAIGEFESRSFICHLVGSILRLRIVAGETMENKIITKLIRNANRELLKLWRYYGHCYGQMYYYYASCKTGFTIGILIAGRN